MKHNESKFIGTYCDTGNYCVLIPVYYENESRPAWRKYFIGTYEEAQAVFTSAPDFLKATPEEEKNNRHWKMQEYLFLLERGNKKEAAAIKAQYKF